LPEHIDLHAHLHAPIYGFVRGRAGRERRMREMEGVNLLLGASRLNVNRLHDLLHDGQTAIVFAPTQHERRRDLPKAVHVAQPRRALHDAVAPLLAGCLEMRAGRFFLAGEELIVLEVVNRELLARLGRRRVGHPRGRAGVVAGNPFQEPENALHAVFDGRSGEDVAEARIENADAVGQVRVVGLDDRALVHEHHVEAIEHGEHARHRRLPDAFDRPAIVVGLLVPNAAEPLLRVELLALEPRPHVGGKELLELVETRLASRALGLCQGIPLNVAQPFIGVVESQVVKTGDEEARRCVIGVREGQPEWGKLFDFLQHGEMHVEELHRALLVLRVEIVGRDQENAPRLLDERQRDRGNGLPQALLPGANCAVEDRQAWDVFQLELRVFEHGVYLEKFWAMENAGGGRRSAIVIPLDLAAGFASVLLELLQQAQDLN